MKRYQVEKLAVVKLRYCTTAKNEINAAKAMHKHEEDLDEMDIEYVLTLEELGTYVKDITPKSTRAVTKKNKK